MVSCDFTCDDVEIIKHFQNMKYEKDSISMMLISEAMPHNVSEYFDAKGIPQFIKNTNMIFNDLGYNYKMQGKPRGRGSYWKTERLSMYCGKENRDFGVKSGVKK